jgi:hypothetical protein
MEFLDLRAPNLHGDKCQEEWTTGQWGGRLCFKGNKNNCSPNPKVLVILLGLYAISNPHFPYRREFIGK